MKRKGKNTKGQRGKKKKLTKQELTKREERQDMIWRISQTEDVDEIIEISKYEDADIRLKAIEQLCPCKVQKDIDAFWQRLLEMVEDPDDTVRMQILHNLCDGSPPHLEAEIKEALEKFNSDPNKDIRRRAHKVLASYLRTGDWNVL